MLGKVNQIVAAGLMYYVERVEASVLIITTYSRTSVLLITTHSSPQFSVGYETVTMYKLTCWLLFLF